MLRTIIFLYEYIKVLAITFFLPLFSPFELAPLDTLLDTPVFSALFGVPLFVLPN